VKLKKKNANYKNANSEEVKIIKMAQIRFDQTKFPSKDPRLNYELGYLQGYQDSQKIS
jgi:hypothetical protein